MTFRSYANRKADLDNAVSVQSAGAYFSKSILTEHVPYVDEINDGTRTITFNYHFLKVFRRWLAGVVPIGEEYMSPEELTLLHNYETYVTDDTAFDSSVLVIVTALDDWLIDELMNLDHTVVTRNYSEDHPWRHTEERENKLWQDTY